MVGLLSRDDRSVCCQWEMDTWVGHQVSLELSQIYVESTIEPQRSSDGTHNLTNQSVEIGVGWSFDVQVSAADVIDGLIVYHEGTVRVRQGSMGGEDGVVRFYHSCGYLWSRVDCELQLGLLAVVHGETFHEQGSEARPGTSSKAVEKEESLKAGTLISQFPDTVQDQVDDLLADGVVTTGVVVSSIFLAGDQLLWVEQLAVGTSAHFINYCGLKINENSPGDVLASSSLAEEGVEGVVASSNGLVRWHLSIRLDAMLQTVQLPAGVADLDTSLSDVDGDYFTHIELVEAGYRITAKTANLLQ